MSRPSKRKMKSEIRAVADWAETHGWTLQEGKDSNGHWVLKHPKGGVVKLPDTPSDVRGVANARAEIRRKSGIRNDSGPAARYRHESRRRGGFDMDAALK